MGNTYRVRYYRANSHHPSEWFCSARDANEAKDKLLRRKPSVQVYAVESI